MKVAMQAETHEAIRCPFEGLMGVVGKRWSLLLINSLGRHAKLRYGQLMDELKGVSPKSLADALKELTAQGLIERHPFNEIPPRVEYSLTADGTALRRAIIPLLRWAAERSKGVECPILASITTGVR